MFSRGRLLPRIAIGEYPGAESDSSMGMSGLGRWSNSRSMRSVFSRVNDSSACFSIVSRSLAAGVIFVGLAQNLWVHYGFLPSSRTTKRVELHSIPALEGHILSGIAFQTPRRRDVLSTILPHHRANQCYVNNLQQNRRSPPFFNIQYPTTRLRFRRVTDGNIQSSGSHIPPIMSMAVGFASALTSTKQVD